MWGLVWHIMIKGMWALLLGPQSRAGNILTQKAWFFTPKNIEILRKVEMNQERTHRFVLKDALLAEFPAFPFCCC